MADKKNYTDREFAEKYRKANADRRKLWDILIEETYSKANYLLWSLLAGVVTFSAMFSTEFEFPFLCYFFLSILVYCAPGVVTAISFNSKKNDVNEFYKEYGLNKQQGKRLYDFILNEGVYMALIKKICGFNQEAKASQVEKIKKLFHYDDAKIEEYIWGREYSEGDLKYYISEYSCKSQYVKSDFVTKLFKLAALEDGIHDDEWFFLMNLLISLRFDKTTIEDFRRRFSNLRSEFYEEERQSSKSTKRQANPALRIYYDILGLDENATDAEIKKAYHALALQHHPDLSKNADRVEECEALMAKINEAYEKVRG